MNLSSFYDWLDKQLLPTLVNNAQELVVAYTFGLSSKLQAIVRVAKVQTSHFEDSKPIQHPSALGYGLYIYMYMLGPFSIFCILLGATGPHSK